MQKKHWIAFLVIAVVLVVGAGVWKFAADWIFAAKQIQGSDVTTRSAVINGAGDDYQGYFFITSPEMKKNALRKSFAINWTNDKGTYAARVKAFNEGKYDFIVLPISEWIFHGRQYNYPGRIVMSLAESKGADALVCFKSAVPTGKVTDLNNGALRIVYTPESPSSFMLDAMITDFQLDNLRRGKDWRVKVDGSEEVLKKAKAGQGDCFVMWEPQVQQALRADSRLVKVWSSKDFHSRIVDVVVMHRDFVTDTNRVEDGIRFMEAYFTTMRTYRSNDKMFRADMEASTGLRGDELTQVLDEIHWYDLAENAWQQFGLNIGVGTAGDAEVYTTIASDINVLLKIGSLDRDPLPDPRLIVNKKLLETVLKRQPQEVQQSQQQKRVFATLRDEDWLKLKEVGAMSDTDINFQTGSFNLTLDNAAQADKIGDLLINNYPDMRIVVRGHTASGDDEAARRELSQMRAEAVLKRLTVVKGVDENRIRAEGVGSSMPPVRREGESPRSYLDRRSRVEIILYQDRSF